MRTRPFPALLALLIVHLLASPPCAFAVEEPPAEEGARLLAEGVEYLAAARLEEARSSLEGALAAFRRAGDRQGEARTLKELGTFWSSSGEPAKAIEPLRQALGIARDLGDRDLEARSLNNLGLAILETEGDEKARELFEQSRAVAEKNGNDTVEAIALGNLADLDLARGEAREALPRLDRAASLVRRLGNPGLAARVLATLAQTYDALGNPQEAAKVYEEAVPHASASGMRLGEAGVLSGWGMALLKSDQPAKAVEALQRALAIARELPEGKETEGAALMGLALAYEQLRDSPREAEAAQRLLEVAKALDNKDFHTAAERHLEGARERMKVEAEIAQKQRELAAALEQKDRAAAARLALDLGLLLLGEDRVPEAAAAFDQSLVLSAEIKDVTGQMLALQALIKVYELIVQDPRLSEYLAHMAQAAQELGLREPEEMFLIQLGMARLTAQDPQGAIDPLKRGLLLAKETGQRDIMLDALENLAFAEGALGRPERAKGYAEELLNEAKKAEDHLKIGAALRELAKVHQDQGDLPRAIELFEQSLAEFGKAPQADARRANVLSLLGAARANVGDSSGAFEAFKETEEASRKAGDRKTEALALQSQASIALMMGEIETAEKLLTKSLVLSRDLNDPNLETNAFASLGTVAALSNDHRRSIEHWQKFLAVVRRPSSPLFSPSNRQLEVIALGFLARAHANLKEHARALELANEGLATAEAIQSDTERALALDSRAYVHLLAGRLAEAEADERAAIDLFEKERERLGEADLAKAGWLDQRSTAYDLLQQVLVERGRPAEALAVAESARARAFVEALGGKAEREPSPEDLARIARERRITVVEYSLLQDPTQSLLPGRLEGLQASLEKDLFIWVVRPNGTVEHRRVDLAALRNRGGGSLHQRIRFLHQSLETGGVPEADLRRVLRDIYDVLIAPIAALLPPDAGASVVLVPHGSLFLVPFAALVDPSGSFLLEKHTLVTAPSISSLAEFRVPGSQERWRGNGALIVGNPQTSQRAGMLSPLPEAEKEARQIAAQLGAMPLIGERATEAAVLRALPEARLVHFASHGLLERGGTRGLPGALALAPSKAEEDGLLTAAEIRSLDLRADLVVLSACETGLGRISGDGVLGLSRSFLTAGAAGVVMSLWRIDDEATSSFMIDFHRRLAASGDPAGTLRAAMVEAIRRGESPRTWGAFTYTGAPSAN